MLRRFASAATRLAWGGFVVWLGTVAPLCAQQALNRWDYHKGETTLELTGVFDPPPPSGYQPIRASVRNAAAAKRSWEIDVRFSGGYGYGSDGDRRSSRFAVEVEPNQEKSVILLAPVVTQTNAWRGHHTGFSLEVSVRSPQLGAENFSTYSETAGSFPAIAISDELAKKSLTQLSDEVKKQTSRTYTTSVFGSRYVPAHLPEDWLGFSGFDYVMITADEWLALGPGPRAALLQWVNLGGRLHVYAREGATSLATLGIAGAATAAQGEASGRSEPPEEGGILPTDEEAEPPSPRVVVVPESEAASSAGHLLRGLGSVEIRSWNGDTLEAEATIRSYLGKSEAFVQRLGEDYGSGQKWGLEIALGERNFAGWQVVVFLVLFGILVGPVNLFVLAPSGKRHRLFFTTPVISVAASVIVIGLIFFQDGTGGQGRRFTAILLAPGEAAAYVTQEQISRTGVLFSSGFTLPQPAQYEALRLKDSQWVKLGSAGGRGLESRQEGLTVSGNWFQSRAVQGQFLRARVPTRGRIEWLPAATPEGAPSIISSLDFALETFACLDAQGREWLSPGLVAQGRQITLIPRSGAVRETATAALAAASPTLGEQITRAAAAQGVFFATASAAPGYTLDTLKSIDWRDDQIVVFGPLPVPR